jgi:hypothetical protein
LSAVAAARRERWPGFLKLSWLIAAAYFPFVARHHEAWRLMLPVMPAFALTTAYWSARWLSSRGPLRALAAAALCCAVAPAALATQNNELFVVLGLRSELSPDSAPRELYLERSLDHYAFYRDVNAALRGRPALVLLFREIRGYYLDVPYMWGDPLNQGLIQYGRLPDPAALAARLRELGVTHVLVNEGPAIYAPGGPVYDLRTIALMDGVLRRSRRVLLRAPLSLYEIN